mmetsp:Transcript_18319/g.28583  ORF Transcript_18319/g.28583 Transcript_18319/m.28583 type:complete len:205 (-) Transcript_18319:1034-1648(-)
MTRVKHLLLQPPCRISRMHLPLRIDPRAIVMRMGSKPKRRVPLRNCGKRRRRSSPVGRRLAMMNRSWIMVAMKIVMRITMRAVPRRRGGVLLLPRGKKIRRRHPVIAVAVAGWMICLPARMRRRGKNTSKRKWTISVKSRFRDIACRYGAMNLILPILSSGRMFVSRLEWIKVQISLAIACARLKVLNRGMSTNFRKVGMESRL